MVVCDRARDTSIKFVEQVLIVYRSLRSVRRIPVVVRHSADPSCLRQECGSRGLKAG